MKGNISDGYAKIDSVPFDADTTTFNVPPGTRILDTNIRAHYKKVSALGSNTRFIPGGVDMAWNENFLNYATTDTIAVIGATGLVRATTANLLHQIYTPNGQVYGNANLGTQTLPPVIVADGLDIGGDQTSAHGYEVFSHFTSGVSGRPFCVGRDPAFFFYAKIKIGDVSGTDTMLIGFRTAEVNNGTLVNYANYIGMGFNTAADPAAIKLIGEINNSAPASYPVDTTQTIADGVSWQVKIMVDGSGNVTYTHDAAVPGTLAAPTAIGTTPTLTSGLLVIPFIYFLNSSDLVNSFVIQQWVCGYIP